MLLGFWLYIARSEIAGTYSSSIFRTLMCKKTMLGLGTLSNLIITTASLGGSCYYPCNEDIHSETHILILDAYGFQ